MKGLVRIDDVQWRLAVAAREWIATSGIRYSEMHVYEMSGWVFLAFVDGPQQKATFRMSAEALFRHDAMDGSWHQVTTIYELGHEEPRDVAS